MSTAELAALGEVLAADHTVEQGAAHLGLNAAGFHALLRSVTDADLAVIRVMRQPARDQVATDNGDLALDAEANR